MSLLAETTVINTPLPLLCFGDMAINDKTDHWSLIESLMLPPREYIIKGYFTDGGSRNSEFLISEIEQLLIESTGIDINKHWRYLFIKNYTSQKFPDIVQYNYTIHSNSKEAKKGILSVKNKIHLLYNKYSGIGVDYNVVYPNFCSAAAAFNVKPNSKPTDYVEFLQLVKRKDSEHYGNYEDAKKYFDRLIVG